MIIGPLMLLRGALLRHLHKPIHNKKHRERVETEEMTGERERECEQFQTQGWGVNHRSPAGPLAFCFIWN